MQTYALTTASLNLGEQLPGPVRIVGNVQILTGPATIQGSANGTNWVDIATTVAAGSGVHVAIFPFMRLSAGTGILVV